MEEITFEYTKIAYELKKQFQNLSDFEALTIASQIRTSYYENVEKNRVNEPATLIKLNKKKLMKSINYKS